MLSVIICTHNPRWDYFQRCIERTPRSETARTTVGNWLWWTIEATHRLLIAWISAWHPERQNDSRGNSRVSLRLACAAYASQGEICWFSWMTTTCLMSTSSKWRIRTMEERPFLGSWSGQCRPAFEQTPPEWTRRYWGNLVIREFDNDVWSNLPRLPQSMPCGAGLCVRRKVALHYLDLHESGKRSFQFDRNGKSLLSGGDNDLAACACDIGLGVGLIASLKLTHLISPERLTEDYLARLSEGIHFSSTMLDAEYGIRTGERTALGRAADFLRMMRLRQPHRRILRAAFRGRDRAMRLLIEGDMGPARKMNRCE